MTLEKKTKNKTPRKTGEVTFCQVVLWPGERAQICKPSSALPFCHLSLSWQTDKKGQIFALGNQKKTTTMYCHGIGNNNKRERTFFWARRKPQAVLSNSSWSYITPEVVLWGVSLSGSSFIDEEGSEVCAGLQECAFQSWSEKKNNLKKRLHINMLRVLHSTSSQSLVDSNLLVAERPIGQYGKRGLRKGGSPSTEEQGPRSSVDECGEGKGGRRGKGEGRAAAESHAYHLL